MTSNSSRLSKFSVAGGSLLLCSLCLCCCCFALSMTEWNPDNSLDLGAWKELGWTQHPHAKKCLSLKNSKSPVPDCFKSRQKGLNAYQQPFVHENMKVNMWWAVKNFEDWTVSYNKWHPEKMCPENVIFSDDPPVLSSWLQKFIVSTWKKNGEPYSPWTIHFLLTGLHWYMREKKGRPFTLICHDTTEFKQLMTICDNFYRELPGVGANSKPRRY